MLQARSAPWSFPIRVPSPPYCSTHSQCHRRSRLQWRRKSTASAPPSPLRRCLCREASFRFERLVVLTIQWLAPPVGSPLLFRRIAPGSREQRALPLPTHASDGTLRDLRRSAEL